MSLDHLPGRSDPETRLRAWLDEQAPTTLPVDLAERVRSIPARTPMPSRRLRAGRATWSGARLLAAAAIVAVGVGALVVAGEQLRSAPAPTTVPAPSAAPVQAVVAVRPVLPVPLPSGIEGGTVETPIGPARWVHLTVAAATSIDGRVPLLWFGDQLLYVSGGSCAVEGEVPPCAHPGSPPTIETAPDALAPRTSHPLPVAAQGVMAIPDGDSLWITTIAPDGLWRTRDLERWEPVDLSTQAPAPLDGSGWAWNAGSAITGAGGETFLSVAWRLTDPGRLVGQPGVADIFPIALGDDVYLVRQLGSGPDDEPRDLGQVRLESTADGLRFRSMDGAVLSELLGVDRSFVDDWATDRTVAQRTLVRLAPDGLSTVQLPAGESMTRYGLLPVADGWLAVGVQPDTRHAATWRSPDGLTWTLGPLIGDAEGPWTIRSAYADMWHRPATIVVVREDEQAFASTDGTSWQPIPPRGDSGYQLASGAWVRWDGMQDGIDVSRDGLTWEPANALTATWGPDMTVDGSSYTGSSSSVGDALFRAWESDPAPGDRDTWIIDFTPVAP